MTSYYTKHPEKMAVGALAIGNDGTPLGWLQMCVFPMKERNGIYELKPGEAYIEQVSVAAAARGRGIGTALLRWAEAQAGRAGGGGRLSGGTGLAG